MKQLPLVETAAWIATAAMLGTYFGARHRQDQAREAGIAAFHATRGEHTAQSLQMPAATPDAFGMNPQPPTGRPEPMNLSDWSAQRVARYPQSLLDPQTPTALLRIPAVKLTVPVFEGTSEQSLNRGAGHIEGTAPIGAPGNLGIAAHRDGFFRALKDVQVGHALYIDQATATDTYRIVATYIVEPDDVSVLQPTSDRAVTLVTCYPFYFVGPAPRRYIVRAQLVPACDASTPESCPQAPERDTERRSSLWALTPER